MPKGEKYYAGQWEKTIIGFSNNEKVIINAFDRLCISGFSNDYSSLKVVGCSDTYHGLAKANKNIPSANPYFALKYAPGWVEELISDMNAFFKYWDIELIAKNELKVFKAKFGKQAKVAKKASNGYEQIGVCYSILYKVVPTAEFKKKKYWKLIFHHLQLYMHHIFRVASLSHGNYIDNDFKPKFRSKYWKHPFPYLEYVLNKSYHTRNHGYTLFNDGCVTTKHLEHFNNYAELSKAYRKAIKAQPGRDYRGGYKVYQSEILKELLYAHKFKKGDKVELKGITASGYHPISDIIITDNKLLGKVSVSFRNLVKKGQINRFGNRVSSQQEEDRTLSLPYSSLKLVKE